MGQLYNRLREQMIVDHFNFSKTIVENYEREPKLIRYPCFQEEVRTALFTVENNGVDYSRLPMKHKSLIDKIRQIEAFMF